MTALILTALACYLVGAIPSGLLIARAFGLGDPRQIGSGNIGATNILRTGHKGAAALTLVADGLKAALPVLTAGQMSPLAAAVAAAAVLIGHCYPVYLGFRGGKAVASFLGAVLALAFPVGLAACATWLASAAMFRRSSLAALAATASSPVWALAFGRADLSILLGGLAVLVWARHHGNIRRLIAGTEPRIGQK